MRVLLIGAGGQLATDLEFVLREAFDVVGLSHADLDIADAAAVDNVVRAHAPHLLINCAAYNRVDDAEEEFELALRTNAVGPRLLARACERYGAAMLHTSTDYVFSGEATHAWDEGDVALPMCAYGVSKRAGELAVQASCSRGYIVRLSGLYGTRGSRAKSGGGNFVETMLKLQAAGRPIRVVDDQILAPTSTLDVARKMRELIEAGAPYGVYHMTAAGECSWYEFARGIFQLARLDVDLTPQHTSDVVQRARRPRYSVLANNALHRVGIGHIRPWIEGLEEYLRRRRGSGLLATSAAA